MEVETFLQFLWKKRYSALIVFHTWLIIKLLLLRDVSGLICILDLAFILDLVHHMNIKRGKNGFWITVEKEESPIAKEVAIQTDEEPVAPLKPTELPFGRESIAIQTDSEVSVVRHVIGVGIQTDPACDGTDGATITGTGSNKDGSTEMDKFYMGLDLGVLIRRESATQTDDPPMAPAQTELSLIYGSPPRRFVKLVPSPSPDDGQRDSTIDFLVNEALCDELESLNCQLEAALSNQELIDARVRMLSAEVERDHALERAVSAEDLIWEMDHKEKEWRRTVDQQSKIIKDLQDQLTAKNNEVTVAHLDFDEDDVPLPKRYQDLKDSYDHIEEVFAATIEENENLEKQVQALISQKNSLERQVKALDAKNADLSEEVSSARNVVMAKDTEMEDLLGSFNGKIRDIHTGLQNENSKYGLLDISLPTTLLLDASLNVSHRGPFGNNNLMDWESSQNLPSFPMKVTLDSEVQAVVGAVNVWTQTDNIPVENAVVGVVVPEQPLALPTLANLKKRKEWVNSAEKNAVAANKHVRFAPTIPKEDSGEKAKEKVARPVLSALNNRQPTTSKRNTIGGGGLTNVNSFVSQLRPPGFSFSPKPKLPFKMPTGVPPNFQFKLLQPTPEQRQQQKEGLAKANQFIEEQRQHNNSMRNASLAGSPSYLRNYSSDQYFFSHQKSNLGVASTSTSGLGGK